MPVPVDSVSPCPCDVSCKGRRLLVRRALLKGAVAAGTVVTSARSAFAQEPRMARPDKGDLMVFASGDKAREVITLADLPVGGPPVMAWPMDAATKSLRDGSRLNQVVVIRLPAESLDETTRAHSVDGVVGYSAMCTHALCPVTGWNAQKNVLRCPCHNSEFDPCRTALVVFGPAPRPLPGLPLAVSDGVLTAAGKFLGKVGIGS
jgi:Rieske Fe-S protein